MKKLLQLGIKMLVVGLMGMAPQAWAELVFEKTEVDTTSGIKDMKMQFLFPFENKGEKSVKIKSVKTSCVCLTAFMEDGQEAIPAGGSGKVGLNIDLGAFGSLVEKEAVVETSDGQKIQLKLKIKVPEFVKMEPRTLKWKKGEEPKPKSIKIKVDPALTLNLKDVSISKDQFEFEPKTINPGREYEIIVTPKNTEPGFAMIRITTDSELARYKKCIGYLSISDESK